MFSAFSDVIGKSKIRNGFFKKDRIGFGLSEAELGGVFYYCPTYKEGANATLSYTYTSITWENNPWFKQNHFNTVTLSFADLPTAYVVGFGKAKWPFISMPMKVGI